MQTKHENLRLRVKNTFVHATVDTDMEHHKLFRSKSDCLSDASSSQSQSQQSDSESSDSQSQQRGDPARSSHVTWGDPPRSSHAHSASLVQGSAASARHNEAFLGGQNQQSHQARALPDDRASSSRPEPTDSPLWSIGSELHYLGQCTPCVWFWRRTTGCAVGRACSFCHACDAKAVRTRRKENRRRGREPEGGGEEPAGGGEEPAGGGYTASTYESPASTQLHRSGMEAFPQVQPKPKRARVHPSGKMSL